MSWIICWVAMVICWVAMVFIAIGFVRVPAAKEKIASDYIEDEIQSELMVTKE